VTNPREAKATKGTNALNAENEAYLPTGALERVPNIDEPGRIMDGSDEVNEMRAISYKCMKGTYPPKEVKQFFEHIRPSLHISKSENPMAGEGLMVKNGRGFVKDEIIGAYEGIIVEEKEGPYILKITRVGAKCSRHLG
jgi:hypothetical protein